jgi:hypothetical protein
MKEVIVLLVHLFTRLARLLGTRGTRAVLAAKHGNAVRLLSLKGNDLSKDFPAVVQFVRTIRAETALVDGDCGG